MSQLRDVRHLLETAAYYEQEIERVLDPTTPYCIDEDFLNRFYVARAGAQLLTKGACYDVCVSLPCLPAHCDCGG